MELKPLPEGIEHESLDRRLPTGGQFKDRTGCRCGDWVVVQFAGYIGNYSAWVVRCECGHQRIVRSNQFRKLGLCHHVPVGWYLVARFRTIDNEWESSREMFKCVGDRPEGKFLTRPDRSKPMGPDNFEWSSVIGTRLYQLNGVTGNLSTWAARCGVTRERMRQRLNQYEDGKISLEAALTTQNLSAENGLARLSYLGGHFRQSISEKRIEELEQQMEISIDAISLDHVYVFESQDVKSTIASLLAVQRKFGVKAVHRHIDHMFLVKFSALTEKESNNEE